MHYRQAVALNPRHRSAHEHLGEAYLRLKGPPDDVGRRIRRTAASRWASSRDY